MRGGAMARSRIRRGRPRSRVLLLVVATSLVVAGCGGRQKDDDPARSDRGATRGDLPENAALLLAPDEKGTRFAQLGTAPVSISWTRIAHGQVRPIAGPEDIAGLDMPDFTTSPVYPRAVLVVRSESGHDDLSPGDEDFWWGADFQLDAVSTAPTGPDNGDNLLQRGLWGESAEYKAEVDLRRASCVVHGAAGTLLVRARMSAQSGKWYRMRCYREPESLTVTVRELGPGGWGPTTQARVSGPIGAVSFPASMPISIGGKIAENGDVIRRATDQFNGWIANPVIVIESSS
jgi:hypothetical protein